MTGENEIAQMQLTARGPIVDKEVSRLMDGLKLGHDVVVQAFVEMTTPEAQKHWERTG
jgi:hypothetical protein